MSRQKMTLAEFFMSFEEMNRQTGRTTALAKAAREIGAIFVCHCEVTARMMMKKFPGLDARSMSTKSLIGEDKPVILDHLVTYELLRDKQQTLVRLRADLQQEKLKNQNINQPYELRQMVKKMIVDLEKYQYKIKCMINGQY